MVCKQGETFRLVGEHAQFDFKNNYVTLEGPGFIDAENKNFQLKRMIQLFIKKFHLKKSVCMLMNIERNCTES